MTNSEIKAAAKEKLKENLGTAVVAIIVFGVLSAVVTGIAFPLTLLINGPMAFGMACIFLKMCRNQSTELKDLFSGFSHFGASLVAQLLVNLFVFLWSLLLVIPGIVKGFAYAMTFYILNDEPELGGQEAITRSKEMMEGHKGELFALNLSFIGWYLLGFFTLGIGLLYAIPYHSAAVAVFYQNLKKEDVSSASHQPEVDSEPKSLEVEDDGMGGTSTIPQNLRTQGEVSSATVVLNKNSDYGATTVLSNTQPKEGSFVGLSGGLSGQNYAFPDGMEIRIGRDPEQCNILTADNNTSISRCHCVIQYRAANDVFLLTDTSSNGVFMDGQRLDRGVEYEISRGSVVSLGNGEETFRLE